MPKPTGFSAKKISWLKNPFPPKDLPSRMILERAPRLRRRNLVLILLLLIPAIAGIVSSFFFLGIIFRPTPMISPTDYCNEQQPIKDSGNGIGVQSFSDVTGVKAAIPEYIGISDGTFTFDTLRPDGNLKCAGSLHLAQHDPTDAVLFWTQALQTSQTPQVTTPQLSPTPQTSSALQQESNDGEVLIYRENQLVLDSHLPYFTFIIGTILSGDDVGIGRDLLQGAYVAQEEFNHHNKSVQMYLLIANFSSIAQVSNTEEQIIADQVASQQVASQQVASQIVEIAKRDNQLKAQQHEGKSPKDKPFNFMGVVLGLPVISPNVVQLLKQQNIPILIPTGASESQTPSAANIFRIAASTEREGKVGAMYAQQTLLKKKVALFVDVNNTYSYSLADAFARGFTGQNLDNIIRQGSAVDANGNAIIPIEQYTEEDKARLPMEETTLQSDLKNALSFHPDLIYFAGKARDADVLMKYLLPQSNLQVMGGDALYEIGGFTSGHYRHLVFTASAFPDEWSWLGLYLPQHPFFNELNALGQSQHPFLDKYRLLFAGWPPNRVYGYTRPDNDTILSYDALTTLLVGSEMASNNWKQQMNLDPNHLLQALEKINVSQPVIGFSGRIAFGRDGNPIDKAVVVLQVDKGFTEMKDFYGCFLVDLCNHL